MATETYMLKENAGQHKDYTTGVTVKAGDTIESDLPLDKMFRSKWTNVKDVTKAKAGKKHVSLEDQKRAGVLKKKQAAARKPTKEQVLPVKGERSPAATAYLEPEPGTDAELMDEATRELQGKTAKPNRVTGAGMKPKATAPEPEEEEEDLEEEEGEGNEVDDEEELEEEEEEETDGKPKKFSFGDDVSDEFEGTDEGGLKVFKNEANLFTVTTAGKPNKALNTEELKNKTKVKAFLKEQSK